MSKAELYLILHIKFTSLDILLTLGKMSPLALNRANQSVCGGNPDDVMLMSLGLSQLRHGDNTFTTEILHIHLRVGSLKKSGYLGSDHLISDDYSKHYPQT